jgi:hypothetical protein
MAMPFGGDLQGGMALFHAAPIDKSNRFILSIDTI